MSGVGRSRPNWDGPSSRSMRRLTLLSSGGEVTRAVSRDRPPSCGISNALSLYKGGWTRNAVFVGDAGGSSSVWASPCVHHKVRQLWVFPEDYRRAPEARLQLRGIYNLIEQGLRPVPTEIGQFSEFAHIHPRLEYHEHCPKSAVHLRMILVWADLPCAGSCSAIASASEQMSNPAAQCAHRSHTPRI